MVITEGFGLFKDVFVNTNVLNISWLLSIVFVILTMVLITRDVSKWKTLAFPVTVMWHIAGITPNYLLYMITGIVFAVDVLSLSSGGGFIQAIITRTKEAVQPNIQQREYNTQQRKVRLNMLKELEMKKLRKMTLPKAPGKRPAWSKNKLKSILKLK